MKVLWLIPARSGSRSIPDKNIRALGGHPLLAYRIAAASVLAPAADVWLSTDSERYAQAARAYSVTIPFLRPPELATDTSPSAKTVLHAMSHADAHDRRYEAIGVLEPTSPFVLPDTLQRAVDRLASTTEADAIVATRVCRPSTLYIQPDAVFLTELARRIGSRAIARRQDEPIEVTPSGGFYISRWERFLESESFYTERTLGHRVSELESLEIDEPLDWDWAEFLVSTGRIDLAALGLPS